MILIFLETPPHGTSSVQKLQAFTTLRSSNCRTRHCPDTVPICYACDAFPLILLPPPRQTMISFSSKFSCTAFFHGEEQALDGKTGILENCVNETQNTRNTLYLLVTGYIPVSDLNIQKKISSFFQSSQKIEVVFYRGQFFRSDQKLKQKKS